MYYTNHGWNGHDTTPKLAVEEVSFFGGLKVVLLQLLSIHDRAVGVTNLGVMLLWWRQTNHIQLSRSQMAVIQFSNGIYITECCKCINRISFFTSFSITCHCFGFGVKSASLSPRKPQSSMCMSYWQYSTFTTYIKDLKQGWCLHWVTLLTSVNNSCDRKSGTMNDIMLLTTLAPQKGAQETILFAFCSLSHRVEDLWKTGVGSVQ